MRRLLFDKTQRNDDTTCNANTSAIESTVIHSSPDPTPTTSRVATKEALEAWMISLLDSNVVLCTCADDVGRRSEIY